jgi:RNA-directed DNA polymerase
MEKMIPTLPFERYVDDIVVHCKSRKQAEHVRALIKQRIEMCGLRMHPTKTKIVFCKNQWRQDTSDCVKFDFLGFTPSAMERQKQNGHISLPAFPSPLEILTNP